LVQLRDAQSLSTSHGFPFASVRQQPEVQWLFVPQSLLTSHFDPETFSKHRPPVQWRPLPHCELTEHASLPLPRQEPPPPPPPPPVVLHAPGAEVQAEGSGFPIELLCFMKHALWQGPAV
jgi:hypothetical protein